MPVDWTNHIDEHMRSSGCMSHICIPCYFMTFSQVCTSASLALSLTLSLPHLAAHLPRPILCSLHRWWAGRACTTHLAKDLAGTLGCQCCSQIAASMPLGSVVLCCCKLNHQLSCNTQDHELPWSCSGWSCRCPMPALLLGSHKQLSATLSDWDSHMSDTAKKEVETAWNPRPAISYLGHGCHLWRLNLPYTLQWLQRHSQAAAN
jgi:hypothetical protein